MNEFTIFNGTIWFSDAESVYKHLYPEHGFEIESLGVSDRFVSEDAFIAQRNLKDEYMRRDQKHSETISELRKELKEKQNYIKTLEGRISNQKNMLNGIYGNMAAGNITNSLRNIKLEKFEELENENKVLKARLKEAIGIDYTDSTDYIAQLHKNVLNQRKELRNLNKALECERKRNKELEELYSSAQKNVSMLNLKVMELNQGIRDSTDLTWKEKYDELEEKWRKKYRELNERYISDSAALNAVINDVRGRLKLRENKIEALESGIKELSEANDDLKKKIRCLDHNDMYALHLKDRCAKAENTIDVIKRALVDGDYIKGKDLRRNDK